MSEKIYLDWNNDSLWWVGGPSGPPGSVDYVWIDVYILIEVANTLAAGGYLPDDHQWDWLEKKLDPEVAEEFKKIVVRVNDLTKERPENLRITVDHIKKTFVHYDIKIDLEQKKPTSVEVELDVPTENAPRDYRPSVSLENTPRNSRSDK